MNINNRRHFKSEITTLFVHLLVICHKYIKILDSYNILFYYFNLVVIFLAGVAFMQICSIDLPVLSLCVCLCVWHIPVFGRPEIIKLYAFVWFICCCCRCCYWHSSVQSKHNISLFMSRFNQIAGGMYGLWHQEKVTFQVHAHMSMSSLYLLYSNFSKNKLSELHNYRQYFPNDWVGMFWPFCFWDVA